MRAGVKAETLFPRNAVAVAKSDTVDLPTEMVIYVGGAGDVRVLPAGSEAPVTFIGLAAGSAVPVMAKRVYNTSTTATNLLGVY
jgi:hypothetical protein